MKCSIQRVFFSGVVIGGMRFGACAVLGTLLLLVPARCGICEKISYGVVDLSVDSVEPAGVGLLKIELNHETFLVSEKEASRKVLLRMLKRTSWTQKLPFETFEVILREALTQEDIEVLQVAVLAGLKDVSYADFNKELIWREMFASTVGREVLVGSLRASARDGHEERVCQLLVLAGQTGDPATQESLHSVQAALSERCLFRSIDSAIRTLIIEGDVTRAAQMLESARRVFGSASEAVEMKEATLARGFATIAHAIENSTGDVLASAIAEVSNFAGNVGVMVAQNSRIEELFASTAIDRKRYRELLSYLPHFNLQKRTTRMHESVLAAIRGVSDGDYELLQDEKIVAAMAGFASKDEEILQAYQRMLERMIGSLIDQGKVAEAESVLALSGASLRPLSENMRRIVIDIVRGYTSRAEIESASRVLHQWLSPAPKLLVLDLLLRKYGLSLYSLWLISLPCIGGIIWLRRKRVGYRAVKEEHARPNMSPSMSEPDALVYDQKASAFSQEYLDDLQFFGLKPDATLADIKRAYRQAVKECHPDLIQKNNPESKSLFIAITQRYERLIACRTKSELARAEM